ARARARPRGARVASGSARAPPDRGLAMAGALAAAAAALLLFLRGFVRLRRRGRTDHAGFGRLVLFAAGLACGTLPLVALGDARLSDHMLEHMLIADAVPVLILLALRGPLLFFV